MKYAPILEPVMERFLFEPANDTTFLAINKAVSEALQATGEVAHSQVTFRHNTEGGFPLVEGTVWILPKARPNEPGKNFVELSFKFLPSKAAFDDFHKEDK